MSELQLGLLAIGAGVIASVFLYNKWQEREYRRRAEAGLVRSPEDVLLRDRGTDDRNPAGLPERVEPVLGGLETASSEESATGEAGLSEHVDFVVPVETAEGVSGADLLRVVAGTFEYPSRSVHWEGFDEMAQSWETPRPDQRYSRMRAGLQLADRRGAASAGEIAAFGAAVEETAVTLGALATVPETASAAMKAAELDRFCNAVDIRVAVHVVTDRTPFPENQVRDFAESAGFEFDSEDGTFRRRGGTGQVLCTLGKMETSSGQSGNADVSAPQGVTLELDVPRSGSEDFDQFRHLAEQLARRLGGHIVDENRQPLGPAAFDAIGAQIGNVHRSMEARGINPAGGLALRLFS
jgi:ZipA-like protein with FtsZ-binding domain